MPNFMQGWMDEFEKLLEERSGAALTVTHEVTEPRPAALFLSTITLDGPRQGVLQVAVPDAELVQFVQLAGRRPLDPQVALDEALLAEWKNLLEASAERFAAQLQVAGEGEYTVLLRDLHAADPAAASTDALAGATPATGKTEEKSSYVLRSGDIALRIAINTQIEAAVSQVVAEANQEATLDSTSDAMAASATAGEGAEKAAPPATDSRVTGAQVAATQAAEARVAEEARAAADRAAEEEMDRAATAAETRAAQRRAGSSYDESNPYRTHPERLDLLLDIELEATLRFGSIEMPLRKVLELGPGDVLQLDRHVQEPVELVVGDRIVARGEVVLVGGNFGLHVTEVAEPRRRLETIRCLF
ncbi:MAG TPA: FliM/FliN family flagellar motor C-terminal domain-containing protein [Acidobacteriaceae bacterium]|nr:FliM/FliN family flagellar motor C-terminal domain-containing protein [Acidobacteriaceae bacterium]